MDYTEPTYWPQLKALASSIDGLDYFQVLNLSTQATAGEIRTSYYALARALHPDKFFHISDVELKEAVHKIYKRIVESYMTLKDEPRRLKYVADVTGPDRLRRLRFSETSAQEAKEEQRQATLVAKTPKGTALYQAAVLDMHNQRWDKAFKNLQTALILEPGNADLKRVLEDVDKKRKGTP